MAALDLRAMALGLFLPILYWTGAVVAITLFGYPGVVCMTPAAWLLALPVGLRVWGESQSAPRRRLAEAALSGGLLGVWQGLLVAGTLAFLPLVELRSAEEFPHPLLVGAAGVLFSAPVTAGLAAMIAWVRGKRE